MASNRYAGDRATKWIRRIARVWGALIIGITLFVLIGYGWNWVTTGVADPYAAGNVSPIVNMELSLMGLGALALGIAWRWEGIGGTIVVVSQLVFLTLIIIEGPVGLNPHFIVPCLISIIVATPGVLFLVCWWRSRRKRIP